MPGQTFKAGSTVRFSYNRSSGFDKFKEVFVVHPNWQGKMHGIDLKRLTEAQREVIREVMDPEAKKKRHRIPLVNDILRRMDPIELIKNPISFYNQFVKTFLRYTDAYRTYWVQDMAGVQTVEASNVSGNITNPRPLFGKPLGTVAPTTPNKPIGTKK